MNYLLAGPRLGVLCLLRSGKGFLPLISLTFKLERSCVSENKGEWSFLAEIILWIWIARVTNCIKPGTPLTSSWINNKWAWIGGWRHQLYYHSVGPMQYVGSRNEKWIAALCAQFSVRLLAFPPDIWWVDGMEIIFSSCKKVENTLISLLFFLYFF